MKKFFLILAAVIACSGLQDGTCPKGWMSKYSAFFKERMK